jgi:hypothetical protein
VNLINLRGFCSCILNNQQTLADSDCQLHVKRVVVRRLSYYRPNIVDKRQQLESRHQAHKFFVFGVIVPGQNGETVLRLKLIAARRIVEQYDVLHPPSDAIHILDELSFVECTVLSKQPLRYHSLRVENVH